MQKKFILSFLTAILTIISCSKKEYTEYKVYPVMEKINIGKGASSFIAIKVEIPKDHHIYGNPKGPGIGRATDIKTPEHEYIEFKPARFLTGEKYADPEDEKFTWVFKKETYIFLPIKISDNAKTGAYKIKIDFTSLLCTKTTCFPRDFTLRQNIEIVEDKTVITAVTEDIMKLYNKSFQPSGQKKKSVLNYKSKNFNSISKIDSKLNITGNYTQQLKNENFQPRFIESSQIAGILQAIILGLIAGFILNFMPCVLPVVSLKIMGFVQHSGEQKGELKKLGFLFFLGILTSFAILASLAAFLGYNWGDLFQHREFIIVLTAIVFILALSMFEVFTVNIPSFIGKASKELKNHKTDAYVKGILATLLATPCSGPFLGGTLAWALTQPPVTIYIIFMSIGAGMGLPYLVLATNPGLIKFIPKPGEWTRTFEHIMAFFLIFTVVYLTNILDNSSVMPMVTFLAFLAIGFWQYGKFGNKSRQRSKRILSSFILLVIISTGYLFSFNYIYLEEKTNIKSSEFNLKKIYKNKNSGKISIVKFTADWCPNCKLVEKLSLYTEKVLDKIRENNIDLLVADLTKKNPQAKELMLQLNTHSIPFLAIIPPGKSFNNPIALRDIYTESDVLKGIEMAVKSTLEE